jgi:hypothetical protein
MKWLLLNARKVMKEAERDEYERVDKKKLSPFLYSLSLQDILNLKGLNGDSAGRLRCNEWENKNLSYNISVGEPHAKTTIFFFKFA